MNDLIRRQDAELILAREMYATSLKDGCDPVSPMDFLPEAKAWMSDAPIIGGWIPCSEQEPEEDGYYLVCWSDRQIETEWYENEGWGYFDVVAWMPLPEPYEGQTERS